MTQDPTPDSTPSAEPGRPSKPAATSASVPPGFTGRTLKSADLFGDSRELCIDHEGACYRLRVTQNNKLILTK